MKTKLLTIMLFAILFFSCNGQNATDFATIDAKAFADKIHSQNDPQLIDVRTPEEYGSQHIENAKNINWNGDNFEAQVQKLDKSKPVFVYCMVGGRSKKAAGKLHELGFKEVYNLDGGIMKWNASGIEPKSDKIIGMCNQEYGELIGSNKKVLVNFYADWCEPCKKMAPYILKMQQEMGNDVKIVRLNADENKTMISELKLDSLPALLLYENKDLKWKHLGFISEADLKKQLQ